jgi:diadenosine tetraphosphate (Ap4A) HIT family hydrolase
MWPDNWDRMTAGTDCEMCADAHLAENPHGFLVTELTYSFVRLPRNQYMRGWTVVILKRHAAELFELSPEELSGFWTEVAQVARALYSIYQPMKINYGVFGNLCPHIHCHLLVQTRASDPHKPINMLEQTRLLTTTEYDAMIAELRQALPA